MRKLKRLFNIKEASEYLGISVRHLYRLAQEGRIPVFKVGRLWRFRGDHLSAWLSKHFAAKERQYRRAFYLSRARYQRLLAQAPGHAGPKKNLTDRAAKLMAEAVRGKQLKGKLWHKPKPAQS